MQTSNYVAQYPQYIMPTYSPQHVVFDSGRGCYLIDIKGKEYLDFIAGVAVNSLGYNHPRLVQALTDQVEKLLHVSNLFIIKEQVEVARKLQEKFGGGKVFFCNSGAEAIEGAIKLARKHSKKHFGSTKFEIISMKRSFHGRTLAAITATGQEKYQKGLEPLPAGFVYAEFGNIDSIRSAITANTCAILIEPIQGEGGVNLATRQFWDELQALCREHQLLLVLDEVQTGIGRTGTFFAHEHYGLKPDIICLAKGLGGGIPMGAIIAQDQVAASFQPGDHASTFGGNPLACRAAQAVIGAIEEEDILGHVKRMDEVITSHTRHYRERFPFIMEVRGKGLMWGIEMAPAINCPHIVKEALAAGLLLNCIGNHVLRITPPLIITEEELIKGFTILEEILEDIG